MAHWRDTARPVTFFMVDYRATFPLMLFLMHIRMWTFIVSVSAALFFGLLSKYGFSVNVFGRWLRSYIAGPRKIAQPSWKI